MVRALAATRKRHAQLLAQKQFANNKRLMNRVRPRPREVLKPALQ
jgi:hypothetical protein